MTGPEIRRIRFAPLVRSREKKRGGPLPLELTDDTEDVAAGMGRYASLGLVANPFASVFDSSEPAVACEVDAAGNRLLTALYEASLQDAPRPIWVDKDGDIPSSYPLSAISHAERFLATDDALNVLYAYVQLFMFKIGVTRATLGVIAERISFREFDVTLVPFIQKVLESLDEDLVSFKAMDPEHLQEFRREFDAAPLEAVARLFGAPEIERHMELAGVIDPRRGDLEDDGDEDDDTQEVDSTVGDAPGSLTLMAADGSSATDLSDVRDYLIEYTKTHLSPVIARGLRMYHLRGMSALAEELKVTRAPRKTLAAITDFSKVRFRKTALIYDELQSWLEIPADLRSHVAASMTNLRWKLAGGAVMVIMAAPGEAPELEEIFSGGPRVVWDFHNLPAVQESPEDIDPTIIDEWLSSATLPGAEPLTTAHPSMVALMESAEGSLTRLLALCRVAIDDAADRTLAAPDQESVAKAVSALAGDR